MNTFEDIKNRRSVRTFDGEPLADGMAESILACARAAENPYGLPIEWCLLSAKRDGLSVPVIVGADTYLAGKMKAEPHAEEAFGYSFEHVVLTAQSLGIGTTIIAGTMDRAGFERAVGLAEGEVMPCVSPLGRAAKKFSVREAMMRKGVKADSRLPFEELFFDGSFDKPLTPEGAGVLRQPLEAVRLAPSAVNKQPWRVVLCGDYAHFYEQPSKERTGWDIQKVDIGIAMCHFVTALQELGGTATFAFDNPGLNAPQGAVYIASYRVQ